MGSIETVQPSPIAEAGPTWVYGRDTGASSSKWRSLNRVIATGSKMTTDQRIAMLQGKIIGITGIIELHQGKPEIKVTSEDQIKGSRFFSSHSEPRKMNTGIGGACFSRN